VSEVLLDDEIEEMYPPTYPDLEGELEPELEIRRQLYCLLTREEAEAVLAKKLPPQRHKLRKTLRSKGSWDELRIAGLVGGFSLSSMLIFGTIELAQAGAISFGVYWQFLQILGRECHSIFG
jgi:hypothetical protein